jgi:hypothetical protein
MLAKSDEETIWRYSLRRFLASRLLYNNGGRNTCLRLAPDEWACKVSIQTQGNYHVSERLQTEEQEIRIVENLS